MFGQIAVKEKKVRDLSAKLFADNGGTVSILISPRMKVWEGIATNGTSLNVPLGPPPINYFSFYTHQTAILSASWFTWVKQNARSKLAEISRYFPVFLEKDETVDVQKAAGGVFTVPKKTKTYFWMKIVSKPDVLSNFSRLETHWSRIEYGPVPPSATGGKYDQSGNLSYNTFITFLSVSPDENGLNAQYFDIGELRHFSPDYYSIQNGNRRDLMFDYGKISPFRRT